MIFLSVDTSSHSASLGLFKLSEDSSFKVLGRKDWEKSRSHSEVITTYTSELLDSCDLKLSDINQLCLGLGPGSFTGIRVAVNFIKSLSYSLNIPVYATNSLLPVAYKNRHLASQCLVMTNAFRNMVYCSGFKLSPFQEVIKPFSCSPADLEKHISALDLKEKTLVIGNGFSLYKSLFSVSVASQFIESPESYENVCSQSIFEYFLQDQSPELLKWNQVIPIYIRGSEAEEKLKLSLK